MHDNRAFIISNEESMKEFLESGKNHTSTKALERFNEHHKKGKIGRLIDADILKKVMTEDWFLDLLLSTNSKYAMRETLKDYIDSVPTAYDVVNVATELETFQEEMQQFGLYGMLADMIEVVRKDCVE